MNSRLYSPTETLTQGEHSMPAKKKAAKAKKPAKKVLKKAAKKGKKK